MNYERRKYRFLIFILILIMFLFIIYIAVKGFGRIGMVPTGNVDIFNIECGKKDINDSCSKKDSSDNEVYNKNDEDLQNIFKNDSIDDDIIKDALEDATSVINIYDNNITWNSQNELRIFANPAYELKNVITPGSSNVYQYVVNNSTNFDVNYSISFIEENVDLINMKFKLKKNGEYILGKSGKWLDINNKKINNLLLRANSYDVYSLEWKWLDADNDTKIAFENARYKLSINIKASL